MAMTQVRLSLLLVHSWVVVAVAVVALALPGAGAGADAGPASPFQACVDSSEAAITATYCDSLASITSRVADLIGRMNATEKTACLSPGFSKGLPHRRRMPRGDTPVVHLFYSMFLPPGRRT